MNRRPHQSIGPNGETFHPTLKAPKQIDVEQDVLAIHEAIKGLGTNEDALIEIIGFRDSDQRIQIRDRYKAMFGEDLMDKIKSETSGNFGKLLEILLLERPIINARALSKAMKGLGTNEAIIIEILCTSTNKEIEEIKAAYKARYSKELEHVIKKELSSHFEKFIVGLLQAQRNELTNAEIESIRRHGVEKLVDVNKVMRDVQDIYNDGEGKLGTDESTFIRIFTTRNIWEMKAIAKIYESKTGRSLFQAISSEMSGDLSSALRLTLLTCLDRPKAFSEILKSTMAGLGTNDETLMRIIATRCEIDLGEIADQFESDQGQPLEQWIRDDTSGDYRKLLLALMGKDWKN